MRYQMSGLGAVEIRTLERMPADVQRWLALESKANPEFVTGYLVPVLRTRDPYGQIVEDAAREYAATLMGIADEGDQFYEWESGLGKSWFKKVFRKIESIPKKIQAAVVKVLPKSLKKIIRKVGPWMVVGMPAKTFRKYAGIILTVVGAVLAPFTGGMSMVAASLIVAARTMYVKKIEADKAKKAAKVEAAAMQADADAAEKQVEQQVNDFYAQNQDWFLQHGVKPEDWAKLTLDQKVDLINAGSKGALPPGTSGPVPPPPGASTDPTMAEVDAFYAKYQTQFVAYGITPDKWAPLTLDQKLAMIRSGVEWPEGAALPQTPPITPTPTPAAPAPFTTVPGIYTPVTTMPVPSSTQYVPSQPAQTPMLPPSSQTLTPDEQQAYAATQQVDSFYAQNQGYFTQQGLTPDKWGQMSLGQKTDAINAAMAAAGGSAQAPAGAPAPAAAPDVTKGQFVVFVEGKPVGTFAKLEDASKAAIGLSIPGDRFEVYANGTTTGLRIRTTDGSVDVPPDIEAKVREMSRDQVVAFVSKAEKETAKGGGVPWWLIVGGGAAAAAATIL